MKPTYPLIALLILAFSASATKLPVLEPVASTVSDGGFVDLGTVGPGQTAEIIAESKITEGGTSGQGGIYDHLVFLNVPPGWKGTDSEKYGSPMKAIVVVAKDAPDGDYRLTMEAVDEPPGEGLGNIAFTAMIRKTDVCTVQARGRGNPFIALSLRMQERFGRALRFGLEDEPKLAGVLMGMVIGERSGIPTVTYEDFQRTGVFHVFAINGLHVGLVMAILLVFLRLVRIPRRWCGFAGIPLLALYVFATGAHTGAIRALVMASVWMLSWMLIRPTNGLNNLAAAALVLLVWEPTQLFDGGFLLSFSVVAAIVVLSPRIERPLNRWVAPDPFLPRRFVSRWRRAAESVARHGVRLLSCSLAAWVGLVPLLAVYFHLFTPVSIVANVLVVPLLGVILALGMVGMMAHAVWPWLTLTLNNANFLLLSVMTRGVDWLGRVPGSHWYVRTPPVWLVLVYYALGVALLVRAIPRRCRGCVPANIARTNRSR